MRGMPTPGFRDSPINPPRRVGMAGRFIVTAVLFLSLTGCGDGLRRVHVQGFVGKQLVFHADIIGVQLSKRDGDEET